jgi:scyllo-inositol 2-dehydrogenase (NADP+)
MIRVGLIGRGLGGRVFHAPLIRAEPRMELVDIAGSEGAAALAVSDAVDLVIVSTPNNTHFPLARAALEAGKHVVIDKPFTVDVAEADALIALAQERKRVLSVFHNRRWDGDFLTVRKMLPRLGEVSLLEAHWDRFRPALRQGWKEDPEQGAGLLIDLGPHMIDQALQLLGMPQAVSADVLAQRPGSRIDDYFALTLHYGEKRVTLSSSSLVAAPRPRFAVHGAEGSFVLHGLDPQEEALKAGVDPRRAGIGSEDGVLTLVDGVREAVARERGDYPAFYEGVAKAVLEGMAAPVDPADARDGLRIIEAARRSSAEGRTVAV